MKLEAKSAKAYALRCGTDYIAGFLHHQQHIYHFKLHLSHLSIKINHPWDPYTKLAPLIHGYFNFTPLTSGSLPAILGPPRTINATTSMALMPVLPFYVRDAQIIGRGWDVCCWYLGEFVVVLCCQCFFLVVVS